MSESSPVPSAPAEAGLPELSRAELSRALQQALAAEQAAVYVLAALGGRTSTSQDPTLAQRLRDLYDTHEERRNWLQARLVVASATPTPAAPAYAVPPMPDVAAIATSAAQVEAACSEHYAWLIEVGDAETRVWALASLRAAAVMGVHLGATTTVFPGAPELASGTSAGATPAEVERPDAEQPSPDSD